MMRSSRTEITTLTSRTSYPTSTSCPMKRMCSLMNTWWIMRPLINRTVRNFCVTRLNRHAEVSLFRRIFIDLSECSFLVRLYYAFRCLTKWLELFAYASTFAAQKEFSVSGLNEYRFYQNRLIFSQRFSRYSPTLILVYGIFFRMRPNTLTNPSLRNYLSKFS